MLALMDSRELTGWLALLQVQAAEREAAEEEARMRASSDDGEVIAYGKPERAFEDEDDDDNGD